MNLHPIQNSQSVSTLLVSSMYCHVINRAIERHLSLRHYIHRLMSDPLLSKKILLLRSYKWKKNYQSYGQDLRRYNFRPSESDWALLSILSNGLGFSRCYVFVFLMLIDAGIIKFNLNKRGNVGTPTYLDTQFHNNSNDVVSCTIIIYKKTRILKRKIQKRGKQIHETQLLKADHHAKHTINK